MLILGIDTSYYSSVGLYDTKKDVLINKVNKSKFEHLENLEPLVKSIFENSDYDLKNVDEIIVCVGPASFMGLRIGVGFAQALAKGIGCKISGVVSNDALNAQSGIKDIVVDAKRNEVFYNSYDNNVPENKLPIIKNVSEIENPYGALECSKVEFGIINAGLMCKNVILKKLNTFNDVKAVYIRRPDVY